MTAYRPRSILRQIHLWLGLGLGVLFALLGLTGSALVFYVEIDRALNAPAVEASVHAAPGWQSPEWDRALATGRRHWPERGGGWSFEVSGESGLIHARDYPPAGHHDHHAEREMVWFAADGGSIVRTATWGEYLMSWLYELHMHLLAGDVGSQIVGWSGFALLVLLISGVATWWPRGSWRKALTFKRNAVPQRRLRDLHKHFGRWSAGFLFLLELTGALLALPEIKSGLLAATIAQPDAVPAPQSTKATGTQISIRDALLAAHRTMPDARLAFIDVPDGGAAPFRVWVQVPGDPHRRFPRSLIFVDQYSGDILAVHDVRRGNAATTTDTWIRPIHDGSITGLPTRLLAIVIGFLPTAPLFYGSYGEAFRAPTVGELYQDFHDPFAFANFVSNTALRPELAREFNLGFSVSHRGLLASDDSLLLRGPWYRADVDNMIDTAVIGTFVSSLLVGRRRPTLQYQNDARARRNGGEIELTYMNSPIELGLTPDDQWQSDQIALLDFEDRTGNCNGNASTNMVVRGTVPRGNYRGLVFEICVPQAVNHQDPTLASASLNVTALTWPWRIGYEFTTIDLETSGGSGGPNAARGFSIHLGSTECGEGSPRTAPAMPCGNPNRPTYRLERFNPRDSVIVLDLGALLAQTDCPSSEHLAQLAA